MSAFDQIFVSLRSAVNKNRSSTGVGLGPNPDLWTENLIGCCNRRAAWCCVCAIIIMLLRCYRLRVNYKLYKVYRYSSQDRGPAPPDNIFRNFIISSIVLTQSNFGVTSAHTSAQHSNILHKPSNLNFLQLWRQLWLNGPHSKLYWRLSLPEGIPNIYNTRLRSRYRSISA